MAIDVAKLAVLLEAKGADVVVAQLEGMGASAKGLATLVAKSALAFEGLEKSMEFLKESIAAAAEEEQVFTRMGVAVTNAGENFQAAKPAIDALLESLSDHSTYRVDELGGAFTRLVQLTGNVGGSMKMLSVVTDFAAGRNIALEDAANLVGKAMNGNATMLNRQLGLHGTAAHAIEVLTERYKGNAAALADTMGGAQSQAANAMHELEEAIGGVIEKEGGGQQATLDWRDSLKTATEWIQRHREMLGNLVLGITSTISAIGTLISWIKYPLVGAWIVANTWMYTIIATIENIPPTLKLMAANAEDILATMMTGLATIFPPLHAVLDTVIKKVRDSSVAMAKDATAAIKANSDALMENIRALQDGDEPLDEATKKVDAHTKAHARATAEIIAEIDVLSKLADEHVLTIAQFLTMQKDYEELSKRIEHHVLSIEELVKAEEALAKARKANALIAGPQMSTEKFGAPSLSVDQEIARQTTLIVASLVAQQKAIAKQQVASALAYKVSGQEAWDKQSQALTDSLKGAVTTDFISLTSNIASTMEDAVGTIFSGGFAAAGKAALKGLGNILASMGKNLISSGLAMLNLLPALSNPFTSGPAMIEAGAVLLALGSALGGLMSGGSSSSGGSGGGVAGAGANNKAAQVTNITLSSAGTTSTKDLAPMQPINVGPVIGVNDGKAQRDIVKLIQNAQGRGLKLAGT